MAEPGFSWIVLSMRAHKESWYHAALAISKTTQKQASFLKLQGKQVVWILRRILKQTEGLLDDIERSRPPKYLALPGVLQKWLNCVSIPVWSFNAQGRLGSKETFRERVCPCDWIDTLTSDTSSSFALASARSNTICTRHIPTAPLPVREVKLILHSVGSTRTWISVGDYLLRLCIFLSNVKPNRKQSPNRDTNSLLCEALVHEHKLKKKLQAW